MDANDLVVEAQAAPPVDEPMTSSPAPTPPKSTPAIEPAKEAEEEPLEVSEEELPPKGKATAPSSATNFDNKIDALFAGVTIADVVEELESLSKVFKTREIPRRLARADMMLDSLGLATFFPSLSEAQNKSLEANNYIATRVDDILSKLRGSMVAKEIDLQGNDNPEPNVEVQNIAKQLQDQNDKELARKQMRKDQELINQEKKTPEVEMKEDLTPAIPAAPAAKPTPPTV